MGKYENFNPKITLIELLGNIQSPLPHNDNFWASAKRGNYFSGLSLHSGKDGKIIVSNISHDTYPNQIPPKFHIHS